MITCQESSTIAGTLQILNKYQSSSSQHLQMSPIFTDSLCSILSSRCWEEISLKHKSDQHVCVCVCVYVRTHVRMFGCVWLFVSPWTIAHVHGILQARLLEWVAIPSSRGSSQPRDQTRVSCVSCMGNWILYHCTTWEAQSKHTRP